MTQRESLEVRFSHARMSWHFIGIVALWIAGWIAWNVTPGLPHFDPYIWDGEKFSLLNLLMSIEQCLSNPVIFMALAIEMAADRRALQEVLEATRELIASNARRGP